MQLILPLRSVSLSYKQPWDDDICMVFYFYIPSDEGFKEILVHCNYNSCKKMYSWIPYIIQICCHIQLPKDDRFLFLTARVAHPVARAQTQLTSHWHVSMEIL